MIKKIALLGVMAVLCLNMKVKSQTPVKDLKPLVIGSKVPESFWQQEHTFLENGKTLRQTLTAYKGKILILDFWASWCGSCISKFGHLAELQKEFPQVQILLVNCLKSDKDTAKVKAAYHKYAEPKGLTTIMADEYLGGLFPHRQVPYYVWMDTKGGLLAFSGSYLLNREAILRLLQALNGGKESGI